MLTRPVLVYDGACGFCRRWIDRLERWGIRDIDLVPAQERQGWVDLSFITDEQAAREMVLVLPDGLTLGGGRAIPELCRRIPGLRVLGWLLGMPGIAWIRNRVYAWIAANRGRL